MGDAACRRARQGVHIGIAADRGDAVAPDRDRLRDGRTLIQRDDAPVEENRVGGLRPAAGSGTERQQEGRGRHGPDRAKSSVLAGLHNPHRFTPQSRQAGLPVALESAHLNVEFRASNRRP